MTHTPHELAEEFPSHIDKMHALKVSNPHFAKLFDAYHDLNRAVHRAETLVEPVEELQEVQMRKQRVALKDQIWRMLSEA